MPQSEDTIAVNVVVEMTTASLKAIVENAKRLSGRNEKGHYTVDTADKVSEMISRFLLEKNFEHFVKTTENYR
jgi:DNA repair protein RadC